MWLIWVVVIGMIAGWATGKIMKGAGYGPLMNLVLGIVGGIVGGWILAHWASTQPVASSLAFWSQFLER
jgi:uncharacterized membrane protein YeaQ/YmgE (transglycosylase-associated protein family)